MKRCECVRKRVHAWLVFKEILIFVNEIILCCAIQDIILLFNYLSSVKASQTNTSVKHSINILLSKKENEDQNLKMQNS